MREGEIGFGVRADVERSFAGGRLGLGGGELLVVITYVTMLLTNCIVLA